MFFLLKSTIRLVFLLAVSMLILHGCDSGGSGKGSSSKPSSSSSSSGVTASSSSSSSGNIVAPKLTFIIGEPDHLLVGDTVIISVDGVEAKEGNSYTGALRGESLVLQGMENGHLGFIVPNAYPGNARLEVNINDLTVMQEVSIAEWTDIVEPAILVGSTIGTLRQQLTALTLDEEDSAFASARENALQRLDEAEEALQQLSADELQQVALVVSRLQDSSIFENDTVPLLQSSIRTKRIGVAPFLNAPHSDSVRTISDNELLQPHSVLTAFADIDADVCMNEGWEVLRATVRRTWKIGALVTLAGAGVAVGGLPGAVIVGIAVGVFFLELERSINANQKLLDACIDPISRDFKEVVGLSAQNVKTPGASLSLLHHAAGVSIQNSMIQNLAFVHGEPKYFSITTVHRLPEKLKAEVASWHAGLMNIMSALPLPERWIATVEYYLSPIEKNEIPSGLQLSVPQEGIYGSIDTQGDRIRLQFYFVDTSQQRFSNFDFTLSDSVNPALDVQANATLEFSVDCSKYYSAVLGEWSVTLTVNDGSEPRTYALSVYEGGNGEYIMDAGSEQDIRYPVHWELYAGQGLNGFGCVFSESGFWHFAFDTNPTTILDDPLTGFYTEKWFPGENGGPDIFNRRTYIKR